MGVIALDTNVVVRFLTRDDEAQFTNALTLFNAEIVHIPDTVWLETEWVLRHAYGYEPSVVIKAYRDLLGLPQVHVNERSRLLLAIEWHAGGLDFADALHLVCCQDFENLATFDKAFIRNAANFGVCRVVDVVVREKES